MTDEMIKHQDSQTSIETLRSLMTADGYGSLSIAKTAVKEGPKGLLARGISVLQRWNEIRFGEALLQELEDMRSAGKIRGDFNRTDAGVSSLREFFEMIDGKPDEERFRAFCALFMSANAPDADSNQAILDIELMSILRQLTAGEMHLLSGNIWRCLSAQPKPCPSRSRTKSESRSTAKAKATDRSVRPTRSKPADQNPALSLERTERQGRGIRR